MNKQRYRPDERSRDNRQQTQRQPARYPVAQHPTEEDDGNKRRREQYRLHHYQQPAGANSQPLWQCKVQRANQQRPNCGDPNLQRIGNEFSI